MENNQRYSQQRKEEREEHFSRRNLKNSFKTKIFRNSSIEGHQTPNFQVKIVDMHPPKKKIINPIKATPGEVRIEMVNNSKIPWISKDKILLRNSESLEKDEHLSKRYLSTERTRKVKF